MNYAVLAIILGEARTQSPMLLYTLNCGWLLFCEICSCSRALCITFVLSKRYDIVETIFSKMACLNNWRGC